MKRTLRKRAGLWELSIPLRAPVRGIWLYATFAEAWGYLWRTGYPPGLPSEIKMAARSVESSSPGVEFLADVDDALHQLTADESLEVEPPPPEPEAVSEPVRAAVLPGDELRPAPHASRWKSRAMAVGLVLGLAILLVTLFWPPGHGRSQAQPFVADSTGMKTALPVPNPVAAPIPPPASGAGKARASIQTTGRSWITACVDGKVVFSKLFIAGSQDNVDFIDHAVVRMGDAGPVEITVDGKPVGALGQTGQVRVIELVRGEPRFLVGGDADDCTLAR